MARYNGLIIPRSYNDYYSRNDPQAIKDIVLAATDTELDEESGAPISNSAVAAVIPTTASAANKLATASDISSIESQIEPMQDELSEAQSDIADIKSLIPNTASASNELADKNFVNSTVGTNTANYISNDGEPFTSLSALESYAGTVTNNDYAFITGIDEEGNIFFDRYKASVIDNTVTWGKEYRLNNSSFTAEQWAAIQSGITAEKVEEYNGKQDALESGVNIKTINGESIMGSGDLAVTADIHLYEHIHRITVVEGADYQYGLVGDLILRTFSTSSSGPSISIGYLYDNRYRLTAQGFVTTPKTSTKMYPIASVDVLSNGIKVYYLTSMGGTSLSNVTFTNFTVQRMSTTQII